MKKDSLSKKILLAIGEGLKDLLRAGFEIIFDYPSIVRGFSLYQNDSLNPLLISKGIMNLKRYGYLREKRVKNKKKLYLTSKGRIEIIKNILRQKREKKLKWDGKWRAIIFDIPEASRRDRDFLRRELCWIGFKELQKSVWVYPYEIKKELIVLLKLWKIKFAGDIRFLTIEKMDDKDLRRYFNLK